MYIHIHKLKQDDRVNRVFFIFGKWSCTWEHYCQYLLFFLKSDRKIDDIAVFMLNKTFKFNHSLNKMV